MKNVWIIEIMGLVADFGITARTYPKEYRKISRIVNAVGLIPGLTGEERYHEAWRRVISVIMAYLDRV